MGEKERRRREEAMEKVVASGPKCFVVRKSERTEKKRVAVLGATAQATGSSSRGSHPTLTLAHWITTPGSSGGSMPPRWLGNEILIIIKKR